MKMGVPILGTSAENVDAAEDRELFDEYSGGVSIFQDQRGILYLQQKKQRKRQMSWDIRFLVRPSYVLGGQGMQIAVNDEDVEEYIGIINRIAQEHPILVDKYLTG